MNPLLIFFRRNFFLLFSFSCIYLLLAHFVGNLKFFLDDFVFIFPAVLKSFASHFIQYTHDYGLFRPLALLFYYGIYSLYLFSPVLAHLVPFTLHFLTGIFLFFILRKQKLSGNYAIALSFLYIVFPFTTEAYMWFSANPATIISFILFLQILIITYGTGKKGVIISVLLLQLASVLFYEASLFFFIPLSFLISQKFGTENKQAKRKIFLTTGLILFIPEVIYLITKIIFKPSVVSHPIVINYLEVIHNCKFFISNIAFLFFNKTFFADFWMLNTKIGIEIMKSNYIDILLFMLIIISISVYFIKNFRHNEHYQSSNIMFWLLVFTTSILPLFFLKDSNFPFRVLFLPLILFITMVVAITQRLNVMVKFLVEFLLLLVISVFIMVDIGIAQNYIKQFTIDQEITKGMKQTLTNLGFTDEYSANVLLRKNFRSDVNSNSYYGEHILSCYSKDWCGQAALNMITGRVRQIGIQFKDGTLSIPSNQSYEIFIDQKPFVELEQVDNTSQLKVIEVIK